MSSAIKALVILSLVGLLTKSSTQQPIDEGTWDGQNEVLNRLSTWLDPVIERILAKYQAPEGVQIGNDDFSSKVFHAIIKQDKKNPIVDDPELAYNAIKTLVKDKPEHEKYLHYISDEKTGVRQFSREGLKSQLFDRYISGSCDAYMKQMGDKFERIDNDDKFNHEIKSNEPNLYRDWAYWKICHETFVKPKLSYFVFEWPISKLKDYAEAIADKEENHDMFLFGLVSA